MFKIYLITNFLNGKQYVGQTRQEIDKRFHQHCTYNRKYVSAMQNAVRKYGRENFKIEEIASAESLDEIGLLERLGIAYYNTLSPNGYNIRQGGVAGKFSVETRKKISLAAKGRYTREKKSNVRKNSF